MPASLAKEPAKQQKSAFIHIFKLYLFIWIVFVVTIIGLLLKNDLDASSQYFDQINKQLTEHVIERMLIAETALEGFSSFVNQTKSINHNDLAVFASNRI